MLPGATSVAIPVLVKDTICAFSISIFVSVSDVFRPFSVPLYDMLVGCCFNSNVTVSDVFLPVIVRVTMHTVDLAIMNLLLSLRLCFNFCFLFVELAIAALEQGVMVAFADVQEVTQGRYAQRSSTCLCLNAQHCVMQMVSVA
jgi:hypothetical protein